jgi:hypothetical protein
MSRRKVIGMRAIPLAGTDKQAVVVTIHAPFEEDGMWCCKYQIALPEQKKNRVAYGIDSLQALMLAVDGMQAEVLGIELRDQIHLNWEGMKFIMPKRLKGIWS